MACPAEARTRNWVVDRRLVLWTVRRVSITGLRATCRVVRLLRRRLPIGNIGNAVIRGRDRRHYGNCARLSTATASHSRITGKTRKDFAEALTPLSKSLL